MMVCVLLVHRRCSSSRQKVSMRERVVSMHNNTLYHNAGDTAGALFDHKDVKLGGAGGGSGVVGTRLYDATAVPLLTALVPSHHITGSMSPAQSMSDYEIRLDEKWEFPRDRCVVVVCM